MFGEDTNIDVATHAFRHTYGSPLLIAGADVVYVSNQLGDTIKIVEKTFPNLLEEICKRNIEIIHEQHR